MALVLIGGDSLSASSGGAAKTEPLLFMTFDETTSQEAEVDMDRSTLESADLVLDEIARGTPVKKFAAHGLRDRLFIQSKDALFVICVSDTDRTVGSVLVS